MGVLILCTGIYSELNPLQILKIFKSRDLRKAKHKASGGRGISGMTAQLAGMKNIVVWLLVLGVVSALLTHFVEIFDKHQIKNYQI